MAAERAWIARAPRRRAHAVSIMVVQAAADEPLERDPTRAHAALGAVQQAAAPRSRKWRGCWTFSAARTLATTEPLPTLDGLDEVVEEARLAGADVVLDRPVPPLPAAIELCAVRVVQEALNAAKHARNPHVRVEGSLDGVLDVVVEDDGGSGPRARAPDTPAGAARAG